MLHFEHEYTLIQAIGRQRGCPRIGYRSCHDRKVPRSREPLCGRVRLHDRVPLQQERIYHLRYRYLKSTQTYSS